MTSICTGHSFKLKSMLCCSKCTFRWWRVVLSGSKKWACIFSLGDFLYIVLAQNISCTQWLITDLKKSEFILPAQLADLLLLRCETHRGSQELFSLLVSGRAEGAVHQASGGNPTWNHSCLSCWNLKIISQQPLPTWVEKACGVDPQSVLCGTPEETCSKEWLHEKGTNICFYSPFLVSQERANLQKHRTSGGQ